MVCASVKFSPVSWSYWSIWAKHPACWQNSLFTNWAQSFRNKVNGHTSFFMWFQKTFRRVEPWLL